MLKSPTSKQTGDAAEDAALRYLQEAGLCLVERNYRTPGRGGGEIDLIMRTKMAPRCLSRYANGAMPATGAAASISGTKQGRIVFAARHYLMRLREAPACRFDVVTLENDTIEWLQAAFDAP